MNRLLGNLKFIVQVLVRLLPFLIILFLLVKFVIIPPSVQLNQSEIVFLDDADTDGVYPYIVRIISEDGKCSGTVIDKSYVLTAAHCVVNSRSFMSKTVFTILNENGDDDSGVNGIAVALDLHRDVALIKGDFKQFQKAKVDWDGLRIRDLSALSITSCGFPAGGKTFCSKMIGVSNYLFKITFYGGIIQEGMSGGPAIDLQSKEIIGVNSAVSDSYTLVGPVVGIDELFHIRSRFEDK